MLSRILRIYAPQPAAPPLTDPAQIDRLFRHFRMRMLVSMFIGYGVLYFCRKNISGTLPVLGNDLGYSNFELGILGSTLYATYGLGKFLNGILADRANIRTFMASSLIFSGILNFWFASASTLWILAFAWGLNGWVQSMGFPPVAKGLTVWYEQKGKATRWAVWTCSHQAGTFAVMALTAAILLWSDNSWRLAFQIPAIICIVTGIGLLFSLADTPESVGLPQVHYFPQAANATDTTSSTYRELFFRHVLRNRLLWVVALTNSCVYIIRFGTLDWAAKFLVETKGYSPSSAAGMASAIPLVGIAGVLTMGYLGDRCFKGSFRFINALFLSLLLIALPTFYFSSRLGWNHTITDFMLLASIGFLVGGPQSVLGGIVSVDVGGSAKIASSAAGLVGVFGYLGATLSSVGTGWFLDRLGWAGGFGFWIACALMGFLLCALAWRGQPR